jgi:hypothetical protein
MSGKAGTMAHRSAETTGATPFAVNRDAAVRVERIGIEGEAVTVVDDLLHGSENLVEYAANVGAFSASRSYYPGLRAPGPPAYPPVLHEALKPILAEVYGLDPHMPFRMACVMSLVTVAPDRLDIQQRLPHVDTTDRRDLAILHFLCGPEHGGTAFFRHRRTDFETLDVQRREPFFEALDQEIREGVELPGGYLTGSNPLFEQIGAVEARFNRIVIYRSALLHSGLVNAAAGLSSDPRRGRLTANTFLTAGPPS